jgi:hypothetical protein
MSVNMARIEQEKGDGDAAATLDLSLVDSESASFLKVPHATTKKLKKEVSVFLFLVAARGRNITHANIYAISLDIATSTLTLATF